MKIFTSFFLLFLFISGCYKEPKSGQMVDLKTVSPNSGLDQQLISINKIITENPQNPSGYYKRAKILSEKKEFSLALKDLDIALRFDSTSCEYHLLKLLIHKKLNQYSIALDEVRKCDVLNCQDAEIFILAGEMLFILKEYEKAMLYLSKAIRLNQFDSRIYFYKGLCYAEQGDTINAISNIQTSLEQNPDFYPGYDYLAVMYCEKKNYTSALQYSNSAITIYNLDPVLWFNRGVIYFFMKNIEKAAEDFNRAIQLDTLYSEAYLNLGNCFFNLQKYEDAKKQYSQLLKIDSTSGDGLWMMARTEEMLGNYSIATEFMKKLLVIEPGNKEAIKKEAILRKKIVIVK